MMKHVRVAIAGSIGALLSYGACAEEPEAAPPQPTRMQEMGTESGVAIFEEHCAACHNNPDVKPRAPDPGTLRQMSPEKILDALTDGMMKVQGESLSSIQRRRGAEYLSGRPLGSTIEGDVAHMTGRCASSPPLTDPAAGPSWDGWGADVANTRFQDAAAAGLTAADVPRLKLKWAFGFPKGVSAYSQPTVVSGRVFTGSDIGFVYSLDAKSGCSYWSFAAQGAVRTAPSVGPIGDQEVPHFAAFFGDAKANVYAVDAETGRQIWTTKVDDRFTARITGAPTLYKGRLYVPVSASEEFSASTPGYPCCTFRGSVVALDASTGNEIWKTYVIPEEPKPIRKNAQGTQLWAPAGGSIWNAPTIDPVRNALYVGTGDSETAPESPFADAVLAISLEDGKVLWHYQAAANDVFLGGCEGKNPPEVCPRPLGGDLDIGNSPILRALAGGGRVVVAGTKDGSVIALDPDHEGAVRWRVTVAERPDDSPVWGVVFGGAADAQNVYYPLVLGAMVAVRLSDGHVDWKVPLTGSGGHDSNAAAASAIPGVAFVGGSAGVVYALSTADGHVIWQTDTARDFETVNGVKANGGSMNGPGPVIAGGMLFVGSGYGVVSGKVGNALLAFAPE